MLHTNHEIRKQYESFVEQLIIFIRFLRDFKTEMFLLLSCAPLKIQCTELAKMLKYILLFAPLTIFFPKKLLDSFQYSMHPKKFLLLFKKNLLVNMNCI